MTQQFPSACLEIGRRKKYLNTLVLCCSICFLAPPSAQPSDARTESGYVTSGDGVRLYYTKVGDSSKTVIVVPGRLFAFHAFQRLAYGRTIIFYDMRNRGRSDAVTDLSKISLQHDVDDLEAVRAHFGIEKPDLIGFSYLGKIVILYAIQYPDHVNRIVQLGPVARKLATKFPEALSAGDADKVPDPGEERKLGELENNGFAKDHPKEYCEMDWKLEQQRMVGNPANANRIPSPCEMENEWPTHLAQHFIPLLASDEALDIPKESIAKVTAPVLTIHGTKDRNAPYGGGREWDMLLPNARLVTIEGAAHMSWVEFPQVVFPSIDLFLNGNWPVEAEHVTSLELVPKARHDSLPVANECSAFSSTSVAAVRAAIAAYPAAWMAGDSEAVMRLFSPDAVLMPHHGDAPVEGEAAIRSRFWPSGAPYFRVDAFRMEPAEVTGCADLAYVRGTFAIEYTTEVDGVRMRYANAGNYVIILRKRSDRWLISRYIWDDPAPRVLMPTTRG